MGKDEVMEMGKHSRPLNRFRSLKACCKVQVPEGLLYPVSPGPPLSQGPLIRNCTVTANAECTCSKGLKCRDKECMECDPPLKPALTTQPSEISGSHPPPTHLPYAQGM